MLVIISIKNKLPRISTPQALIWLLAFMFMGVIASLATSYRQNWDGWNFSHLGTENGISSLIFNVTLILSGVLVFFVAYAIENDLKKARKLNPDYRGLKPWVFRVVITLMGMSLLGVALVPSDVSVRIHNRFGYSLYWFFLGLALLSPLILPKYPRWFYMVTYGLNAVLLSLFILHIYWRLGPELYITEIITFAFIFVWLFIVIKIPHFNRT